MAKVSRVIVPEGLESYYKSAVSPSDRFTFSSIRRKPLFTSVKRKKGLTLKSLMPLASQYWDSLSPEVQENWRTAGLASNQQAFSLFLRDVSARVRNELSLPGTPSDLVQYRCGRIEIEAPASACRLVQEHPYTYYVLRKVRGTRDQYDPVQIIEDFTLPLTLEISYKTDLTSAGPDPKARFYAEIYSIFQGKDIVTPVYFNFGLNDDWTRLEGTVGIVLGKAKGYALFVEVEDCVGTLDFDNPVAFHSGQNWVRDPRCDSVASSFTRAYYQVARHWVAEVLPDGAGYDSIYYNL